MTSSPKQLNSVPFNPGAKEAYKNARKHIPVPQQEAMVTLGALLNASPEEVNTKMPELKEYNGDVVLELYPAQDKTDGLYQFGFLTPPFDRTENRSDNWSYKIDFQSGEIVYVPKQTSRSEIKGVLNKN